jgi:hypothetical protein
MASSHVTNQYHCSRRFLSLKYSYISQSIFCIRKDGKWIWVKHRGKDFREEPNYIKKDEKKKLLIQILSSSDINLK